MNGYNNSCTECMGCTDCNDNSMLDSYYHNCVQDIICSKAQISICKAELYCTIAQKLSCEIAHACCMQEFADLLRIARHFLEAEIEAPATAIAETFLLSDLRQLPPNLE